MQRPRIHSLRNQHLAFAVLLSLAMLVASIVGYIRVNHSRENAAQHYTARTELLGISTKIRNRLLDAYRHLDLFLLEPSQTQYRTHVIDSLNAAISLCKTIKSYPNLSQMHQEDTAEHIEKFLNELKMESALLFTTRIDTNRQYPAMAIINAVMRPNRTKVNQKFAVLFEDLRNENWPHRDPNLYQAFDRLQILWIKMVGMFRIYLANRIGSFNEAALPGQEVAISNINDAFITQLQKIKLMDLKNGIGFESRVNIGDIGKGVAGWFKGYQAVQRIHHSGKWRIDSQILMNNIAPLFALTSDALSNLEDDLSNTTEEDVKILGDVAKTQNYLVWLTALSGIVFILLSVILSQRFVFNPIANLSKAIRAVAFGKSVSLPKARSLELQSLIDSFREMRDQVHYRQSELEYQALHDALTSLPNRTLLQSRIEHDISISRRESKQFSLFIIDLNRFKEVNDTLGHQVGDILLIEVGARLAGQLRDIDTVARLGGDEFAILLPETNTEQARIVANKICRAMEVPFKVNELQLYSNTSIGIAVFPIHGESVEQLIKHADVAMYIAKQNQLGYCVYDSNKDDYSVSRFAITNELRAALLSDKLHLNFQPKYNAKSGNIVGCECLLRWQHEHYGVIPPDQIIQLAEQTGLINQLTFWVLNTALAQYNAWRTVGIQLPIAINLSVYSLRDPELLPRVDEALRLHSIPPQHLTFEITESAMMANPVHAVETLTKLKALGIRIAVDDFGTGFSSLAYLKQMPVDELKIDKSFIIDMYHNENDEVIVRSTIELAHNLGLIVVAEGVEIQTTWLLLRSFSCDIGQGNLLSSALDGKSMQQLMCNELKNDKSDSDKLKLISISHSLI